MAMRKGKWLRGATIIWAGTLLAGSAMRVLADCSSFGLPFTDLGSTSFCAQIAEAYWTGLSNGTSATTYSPAANVPREQMAAFVTRTLDQSLLRGSRRAGLDQWWTATPHFNQAGLGLTAVVGAADLLKSDGVDVWVANKNDVSRIRASDGKKLEDWTGATNAYGVLVAMGHVFATGFTVPGNLYMIDPSQTAGAVTTVSSSLGPVPSGIAFDGNRIWTASSGSFPNHGGISIVTPGSSIPWSVTNVTTGFSATNGPAGLVFDGVNMWVTDEDAEALLKLDTNGAVIQTVAVGTSPLYPAFDGRNIWVPNNLSNSLTVVRASDGAVLKTFSAANGNANGLNSPTQAAFDGQRIMVANAGGGVSLFRATDLSVIGNRSTTGASAPRGVCSDGLNFWVSFNGSANVGRF